jgi:heat shock protein HslJ
MKKYLFVPVVFLIAVFVSCKTAPKFSDVMNKEWKLIDVLFDGKSINFDRDVLENDGFGEIFTLKFDAEMLSGAGAPNRFFAPYTLGDKQAIEVKLVGSTLMFPINQPEKLKEHDYFKYIQNTYEWDFKNNSLLFYSKSEDGNDVTLVFVLE